jgi:tRNA A-37 threonylcarbamoyl transferase component Bud32
MNFQFGTDVIDSNFDGFQNLLKQFYERKRRLCLCKDPGIELYIAKVNESYILKRMPKTGGSHAPTCLSFEPPEELSGLGEVQGQAIQENLEDGTTNLKLDFSLTKMPGKLHST